MKIITILAAIALCSCATTPKSNYDDIRYAKAMVELQELAPSKAEIATGSPRLTAWKNRNPNHSTLCLENYSSQLQK